MGSQGSESSIGAGIMVKHRRFSPRFDHVVVGERDHGSTTLRVDASGRLNRRRTIWILIFINFNDSSSSKLNLFMGYFS